MPSWRDRLKPASFRGVAFQVEGHEFSFGRRTSINQFPNSERISVRDMGRKEQSGVIDCFVIGSDYMDQRDRLIEALSQKGSGTLIHPYFGEMQIQVQECSVRETQSDSGMAVISMSWVESGDAQQFRSVELSQEYTFADISSSVRNLSVDHLSSVLDVLNQPSYMIDSLTKSLDNALSKLEGLSTPISDSLTSASNFKRSLYRLKLSLKSAFSDVKKLGLNLAVIYEMIKDSSTDAVSAARQMESSIGHETKQSAVLNITERSITERINLNAVDAFVQTQALTALCEIVVADTALETIEKELFFRRLTTDFEGLFDLYASLEEIQFENGLFSHAVSLVSALVTMKRLVLNVLVSDKHSKHVYDVYEPLPLLVLMQNQYGSIKQETLFLSKNKVKHPLFVEGVVYV